MAQKVYICRHGETEWSLSGQHTSTTDIPLTENGVLQAKCLGKVLEKIPIDHAFSSSLQRARHTAELAGFPNCEIDDDLFEWRYGDCEGKTTVDYRKTHPGWELFDTGAAGGETPDQVAARADRLVKKIRSLEGDVVCFTHGHFSRVLGIRWVDLPVQSAKHFILSTASLCILTFKRDEPVIELWNDTHHWRD